MEQEKEQSGAEAIAPLFEGIESEDDNPCKDCDGTSCPLLEEMGVTCMGVEGLIIPAKEE